jgi:hypothetical protein
MTSELVVIARHSWLYVFLFRKNAHAPLALKC